MSYKVVALGVGALAWWGLSRLTKLVSSSASSGWRSPDFDKLKMNTAGSVTNSEADFGGRAGFGVVIRGDFGGWVIGFCGRVKDCSSSTEAELWGIYKGLQIFDYGRVRNCPSSTEAELWGIYKGLQIIEENNFREVEIETDLQSTVQLINYGNHGKSPIKEIAEECKVMMLRMGCTLKLIDNNANKVAGEMANLGRDQDEAFVLHSVPPDQKIGSLSFADYESARSFLRF